MVMSLERWTVDYGDGPREVRVPHAWNQAVPVDWEGPAVYRTILQVPPGPSWLVFHGASYEASVWLDGQPACVHRGIWDAFSVRLASYGNRTIGVEVRVVKNGGEKFPVRRVASGFLPFVFQTFGGLFREVELVRGEADPVSPRAPARPRATVEGTRILVDGVPLYVRGLLHWGWYPEIGHPNPDEATIRQEVRNAKDLGFNLVKFCLWVPPHRYLDILAEEGMWAWLELPLWDPSPEEADQKQMWDELERIVLQYRHHPEILLWTCGCELSSTMTADARRDLYQMVKRHTGGPLVKDNSGGSEMYGGDPREFGDFCDFHPYCDAHYFPSVLDSLGLGARRPQPILLGETNDYDVLRDLHRLRSGGTPYWASPDPALNAKGVRWQHDLPELLADERICEDRPDLRNASRSKALWIRKFVTEEVRARPDFAGFVLTGWRDTPISSSGVFDDWGEARFSPEETGAWNGPTALFLIPQRRPPWVHGGNRPGWVDRFNHPPGAILLRVGVHSEGEAVGALEWRIVGLDGREVISGVAPQTRVPALVPTEVGEVYWHAEAPGEFWLEARFGSAANRWPLWILSDAPAGNAEWGKHDPLELLPDLELSGGPHLVSTVWDAERAAAGGVLLLTIEGTRPAPFWRECAFEFADPDRSIFARDFGNRWERLWPVSTDRVVDAEWIATLGDDWSPLMVRLDTRTMRRDPLVARVRRGRHTWIVTTLRPFGGLGQAPPCLAHNPGGRRLLTDLMEDALGE